MSRRLWKSFVAVVLPWARKGEIHLAWEWPELCAYWRWSRTGVCPDGSPQVDVRDDLESEIGSACRRDRPGNGYPPGIRGRDLPVAPRSTYGGVAPLRAKNPSPDGSDGAGTHVFGFLAARCGGCTDSHPNPTHVRSFRVDFRRNRPETTSRGSGFSTGRPNLGL